jgi:GDP-4-dehydro-6-deoxy-D-mannose reductase
VTAFVTGGGGFAGRRLLELLPPDTVAPSRAELELRDGPAVRAAIGDVRPRVVFHLAGRASVDRSWRLPTDTLNENIGATANVLEAVRHEAPEAAVLVVCSGEIYGPPASLPVTEDAPLRPQNPYAVSKAACDLLAGQYSDAFGLRIVRMRPFNHAGPGQSDDYIIGTLTRQVAEAEASGQEEAVLRTGNADSARDFTDVRDVVRAYVAAADQGPAVFNVATGRAVTIQHVIELVRAAARLPVRHEIDPARVRAHDTPEVRGSAERLREATGWEPQIPLEQTVADALDHWRRRLARA